MNSSQAQESEDQIYFMLGKSPKLRKAFGAMFVLLGLWPVRTSLSEHVPLLLHVVIVAAFVLGGVALWTRIWPMGMAFLWFGFGLSHIERGISTDSHRAFHLVGGSVLVLLSVLAGVLAINWYRQRSCG